jgi:hypothetical protein
MEAIKTHFYKGWERTRFTCIDAVPGQLVVGFVKGFHIFSKGEDSINSILKGKYAIKM